MWTRFDAQQTLCEQLLEEAGAIIGNQHVKRLRVAARLGSTSAETRAARRIGRWTCSYASVSLIENRTLIQNQPRFR